MSLLLIDIGNTRLKWATEITGQFHAGGAISLGEMDIPQLFAESFSTLMPSRIILASVANPSLSRQIRQLAQASWEIEVEELATSDNACGVQNAYSEPMTLGIDRWAAMIAAYHQINGAVCVIDCGTALTLDIVNSSGQHLGGLILPGYELMQQAVLQKGERLPVAEQSARDPDTLHPGRDTLDCVKQGSLFAIKSVIEQSISLIQNPSEQQPVIVLTGGDATMLQTYLTGDITLEPYLVLQGMAHLAHASSGEKT